MFQCMCALPLYVRMMMASPTASCPTSHDFFCSGSRSSSFFRSSFFFLLLVFFFVLRLRWRQLPRLRIGYFRAFSRQVRRTPNSDYRPMGEFIAIAPASDVACRPGRRDPPSRPPPGGGEVSRWWRRGSCVGGGGRLASACFNYNDDRRRTVFVKAR